MKINAYQFAKTSSDLLALQLAEYEQPNATKTTQQAALQAAIATTQQMLTALQAEAASAK